MTDLIFKWIPRFFLFIFETLTQLIMLVFQCAWFMGHGRKDEVGDAVGDRGQGMLDAFTRIFR